MLKVLGCVVHEHDLRLVAVSAVICVLGCLTTTTLLARAGDAARRGGRLWLVAAASVLGCSVWSLHFVAMLAFMPGQEMAYDLGLTALSILVAVGGALMALFAWKAPALRCGPRRPLRSAARARDLGHALRRRRRHDVLGLPHLRPRLRGGLGRGQRRLFHSSPWRGWRGRPNVPLDEVEREGEPVGLKGRPAMAARRLGHDEVRHGGFVTIVRAVPP